MENSNFDYTKALAELEEIQLMLENNEVAIDTLATHVKRAHELLRYCQESLRKAEEEVNAILQPGKQGNPA
jgi:exodeoxyribonuclease VII small subunit